MGPCPDMLFALVSLDLASQSKAPLQQVAADALERSLLKKWCPKETVSKDQELTAIEKFLRANSSCAEWRYSPRDCMDEELLLLFQEEWFGFLGVNKKTGWGLAPLDLSPHRAFEIGRCGPGACAGVPRLSFYGKMFAGTMSAYDPDLYDIYRAVIAVDNRWAEAERHRSQRFGLPHVIDGSKLSVVPKNVDVGRTICSEASLNMFCQLGQGMILENRLSDYFGLQIKGDKGSVQHLKNQELARLGSIDGSYATIDLASASDSISLHMLRRFTPRAIMWALERTRAKSTIVNGNRVDLQMISSMGNGYTFPLETAVFASVVSACFRFAGLDRINPYGTRLGNWAVFGDDIIVPTALFRSVVRLLNLLGFEVNRDKTFADGPFRESCGADWYGGSPVRGVYLKQLATLDKRFVAYNSLMKWSKVHKLALPRALEYLLHSIPHKQRHWVPPWENPECGLRTDEPVGRIRRIVQRPGDAEKHLLGTYTIDGFSYRRLESVAEKIRLDMEEDDILGRNINGIPFSPDGLRLCMLQGSIRNGALMVPPPRKGGRYRTGTRVTVNWATAPLELGSSLQRPWQGRFD